MKDEPQTFQILSPAGLEQLLTSDRFLAKLADRLATILKERERARSLTPLPDKEAARRINVSVSTLRRYKRSGAIGSVQTPTGRKVRECDIVKYFT